MVHVKKSHFRLFAMQLQFSFLCSTEEIKSCRFGAIWDNNDRIFLAELSLYSLIAIKWMRAVKLVKQCEQQQKLFNGFWLEEERPSMGKTEIDWGRDQLVRSWKRNEEAGVFCWAKISESSPNEPACAGPHSWHRSEEARVWGSGPKIKQPSFTILSHTFVLCQSRNGEAYSAILNLFVLNYGRCNI